MREIESTEAVGISQVAQSLLLLILLSTAVALGGCSEPQCQKDEQKVGMRCVELHRTSDGSIEPAEDGEREPDASKRPRADANVVDSSGSEDEIDSGGAADRNDGGVVPAAPDTGTTPVPPDAADAGQAPTCVAAVESCDGKDNDCDGLVDEDVMNACGGCEPIEASHAPSKSCDNGGQGICAKPGTWMCRGGTTVCSAPDPTPSAEVCDGKDNDCDGVVDNNVMKNSCGGCEVLPHAKNDTCDNGLKGDCFEIGSYVCSSDSESVTCSAQKKTGIPESCDGHDNDCDGQIDEDTCPAPNECTASACAKDGCAKTPKPKGTPCATGQCDGAGECGFCGDGTKSSSEQCDPKQAGVGTFLCSPECKSRRVYTACVPDDPAYQYGPSSSCDTGALCGAEKFCSPAAPSGTPDSCPILDGDYRQVVLGTKTCVIACTVDGDCPLLVPKCRSLDLSQPSTGAVGYCTPVTL